MLVPEYLVVVFFVGLVGPPLGDLLGHGGALAVLLAALIGTVLVLPTAGEIPILLGLAAAGASAGVLGALLIALPAVSLPSAVMVARALGWRTTAATAGATVVCALVAGGVLLLVAAAEAAPRQLVELSGCRNATTRKHLFHRARVLILLDRRPFSGLGAGQRNARSRRALAKS